MTEPINPDREWERVKQDLIAAQEAQKRAWGDMDEMLLARYLADECSPEERVRVEAHMKEYPGVAECVSVLSRVPHVPLPDPPGQPVLAYSIATRGGRRSETAAPASTWERARRWLAGPTVAWGAAAACFLLAIGTLTLSVGVPRWGAGGGQIAHSRTRQYYSDWTRGLGAGEAYDYRYWYFRQRPEDTEFKRHVVIRPRGSKDYLYYNPETGRYWGKFYVEGKDAGKYSELSEMYRRPYRDDIPPEAFQNPGPMPVIPGAPDGVRMDPPTDYDAPPLPPELMPKLTNPNR